MRILFLALGLATGCKQPDLVGACKDFVAAANACNADHMAATGGTPSPIDDALCDADLSNATHAELQDGVDRYECKADAYGDADCTSADAYEAAIAADAACDGG